MSWISKLLTQAIASAPSTLSIEPRIFITGTKSQISETKELDYEIRSDSVFESSSSSSSVEGKKEVLSYTAFRVSKGRPSIREIINEAVTGATGPVSVDGTCVRLSSLLIRLI